MFSFSTGCWFLRICFPNIETARVVSLRTLLRERAYFSSSGINSSPDSEVSDRISVWNSAKS